MSVIEKGLLPFTRRAMYRYGSYTNEDRALPDYRDGCKPVFRRTIWALNNLPRGQWIKTARVSGDTIGRYHPHGSAGVEGAIDTLMNAPCSPFTGKGNWGSILDPCAAARYTNMKLSSYGELFLRADYLAVSEYVSNYDDTDKEPVVLPVLLPNLILNGSSGIGVGTTSDVPSYTLVSVLGLMVRRLKGEKLEPKDFATGLEFNFRYGGTLVRSKENRLALLQFYKTGDGSLAFRSTLKFNETTKTIRWDDFPPGVGLQKAVDRIKEFNGVLKVENTVDKDGISFEIKLTRSLAGEALQAVLKKIDAATSSRKSFKVNLTERTKVGEKVEVKLFSSTIPEFFDKWLKWRVQLEVRRLKYKLEQQTKAIAYTKLLIHAIDHLDIVMKSLRQDEPAPFLVKHLKITLEEANRILDLKVRQLSKLDHTKLEHRLGEEEKAAKQTRIWMAQPVKKVATDFQTLLDKHSKKKGQA